MVVVCNLMHHSPSTSSSTTSDALYTASMRDFLDMADFLAGNVHLVTGRVPLRILNGVEGCYR